MYEISIDMSFLIMSAIMKSMVKTKMLQNDQYSNQIIYNDRVKSDK